MTHIPPITDPALQYFYSRLSESYGDNLDWAVVLGSSRRSHNSRISTYEVAIFLKNIRDRNEDCERLNNLCDEVPDFYGTKFHALPFSVGDYTNKPSMMKAINANGTPLMPRPRALSNEFELNEKTAEILSKDIFCVAVETSSGGNYPVSVGISNVQTGESQNWDIQPACEWLEDSPSAAYSIMAHDITGQILPDEGLPPAQIVTELAGALKRATTLSDDKNRDERLLEMLSQAADEDANQFYLDDFQDMAWKLACAAARSPEKAICHAEMQALSEYPLRSHSGLDAKRMAETLRLIAGLRENQILPTEKDAREIDMRRRRLSRI